MQENEQYPTVQLTDTQLRIEALVQARNAFQGKESPEITAAAETFYTFLKG